MGEARTNERRARAEWAKKESEWKAKLEEMAKALMKSEASTDN